MSFDYDDRLRLGRIGTASNDHRAPAGRMSAVVVAVARNMNHHEYPSDDERIISMIENRKDYSEFAHIWSV